MARLTFDQIRQYAVNAGFRDRQADTITAIALAESGGNPYAFNPADPGGSYGLTQINAGAHGTKAYSAYGDPQTALNLAYDVSKGGTSFSPWSVYKSGSYTTYLPTDAGTTNIDQTPQVPALSPGETFTPQDPSIAGSTFDDPYGATGAYGGEQAQYDPYGSLGAYGAESDIGNIAGALTGATTGSGGAANKPGTNFWNWLSDETQSLFVRVGVFVLGALAVGAAVWSFSRETR